MIKHHIKEEKKGIGHWKIDPPVQVSKFGLFQNPQRMDCSCERIGTP
jgi:hypothetical protein